MRQNKNRLSLAPVLLQEKRQIERAAETESVPAHARGIRQGHVGEALEQHGEQDDANGSPGARPRNDAGRCQRPDEDWARAARCSSRHLRKASSSRLADAWIVITVSPFGMKQPRISVSSITSRELAWIGATHRTPSSKAERHLSPARTASS